MFWNKTAAGIAPLLKYQQCKHIQALGSERMQYALMTSGVTPDCTCCIYNVMFTDIVKNNHLYLYVNQLGGRGDWSNEGCSNATMNDELRDQDVVICKCNHLSTFGIFVVRCQMN